MIIPPPFFFISGGIRQIEHKGGGHLPHFTDFGSLALVKEADGKSFLNIFGAGAGGLFW